MQQAARWISIAGLGLACFGLAALHLLPTPVLQATTGALIPYQPCNFLSEYVRTNYGSLMIACFFLLALGTLSGAFTLRNLRREAILLAVTGGVLLLLVVFPTDLANLTTDAVTCNLPDRIEPCTFAGRVHNQVSIFVLLPIFAVAISLSFRSRKDSQWRSIARFAAICGLLILCGIIGVFFYLHTIGWQGRIWNGLLQRSLVFPALLWMAGLLTHKATPETNRSV